MLPVSGKVSGIARFDPAAARCDWPTVFREKTRNQGQRRIVIRVKSCIISVNVAEFEEREGSARGEEAFNALVFGRCPCPPRLLSVGAVRRLRGNYRRVGNDALKA